MSFWLWVWHLAVSLEAQSLPECWGHWQVCARKEIYGPSSWHNPALPQGAQKAWHNHHPGITVPINWCHLIVILCYEYKGPHVSLAHTARGQFIRIYEKEDACANYDDEDPPWPPGPHVLAHLPDWHHPFPKPAIPLHSLIYIICVCVLSVHHSFSVFMMNHWDCFSSGALPWHGDWKLILNKN